MNKKIALVITGHFRSHQKNFDNLKKFILDNNNVDIFISTWDMNYTGPKRPDPSKPKLFAIRKFSKDEIYENLNIYPNIKSIKILESEHAQDLTYEKFRNLSSKKWSMGKAVKSCIAWYCVSEGFKLIEAPSNYDILMRFRFDINLLTPIEFKSNQLVVTPSENRRIFKVRNHFQYGTSSIHNFMTNMYEQMLSTYNMHKSWLSEQILDQVLANSKLDVLIDESYTQNINYVLNKY